MPQVSVIMPLYNSENYIETTLKSIIEQTYKDWELIIVDDCSDDDSVKIVNQFKDDRMRMLLNEKHIGAAMTRNKALEAVNGRYITFIDSDDIWKKDKLERQLHFMQENNVAFSFSSYERIDEGENLIGRIIAPNEVDFNYILKDTPIQISTIMIDNTRIGKELLYFKNLKTCEDIAFYMQILKTGIKAKGITECLVKYKVRKKSLSSNKILNTIRRWNLYKEYNISFFDRCKNITANTINSIKRSSHSIKKKATNKRNTKNN